MTNEHELIEELVNPFREHIGSYDGGREGLRCSICDQKYRGDSGFVQLCPVCKARKALTTLTAKVREEEREKTLREERQFILNVLDGIDIADGECNTNAIRKCLSARYVGTNIR